MKSEQYLRIRLYCAALLAIAALATAGCDILAQKCNNGPGNAVQVLSGQIASFELKDSSDYLAPTYKMLIAQPDPYLRWKTASGDYGTTSVICLGSFWTKTIGDDWEHFVMWVGSSTPVCGEIRSLKVTSLYGVSIVQAEVKLPREVGQGLPTTIPAASLVLALGRETCPPTGDCSGKLVKGQCAEPYAALGGSADNASLQYASLVGADLNFATMTGNLSRANLTGASLSNATLTGTNLRGAKLNQTLLVYTDLTGAEMNDVEISGARVYQTTAPDGELVDNTTALLKHRLP